MTAVAGAMLGIMIVATTVLAAVGGHHHLAHSPGVQRRLRRWRYVTHWRISGARDRALHTVRVLRRAVAERLSRPVAGGSRMRQPIPR